jgi:hypothetical protein
MDSYRDAHDQFVDAVRRAEPPTPAGEETGDEARDKRRQLALFIGNELVRLAGTLPGAGTDVGNARELAVGIVVNMTGELIFGAQVLIENGLYYAEASGHREITEISNLLRYFSLDMERAQRWQNSTDADFRSGKSEFRPVAVRESLEDATKYYDTHCQMGGHPRPSGRVLLSNHELHETEIESYSSVVKRLVKYNVIDSIQCDLLMHARRACHAAHSCLVALGSSRQSMEIIDEVILATETWVHTDALAQIDASKTSFHFGAKGQV